MKGKPPKLDDKVLKTIHQLSAMVGAYEEENFGDDMSTECIEVGMESPIEQILYVAFQTVRRICGFSAAEPIRVSGTMRSIGMDIYPQIEIGKYRVDFVVSYGIPSENKDRKLIIECDSQQFHDRSEPERRYEKARDRFLQKQGYIVFRFTGSEIIKEPVRVASEVISHLADMPLAEILATISNYGG